MTKLIAPAVPGWPDVTRFEVIERLLGGDGGPLNRAPLELLERTEYLKNLIEESIYNIHGELLTAIGNDPNFAETVNNELANKAGKSNSLAGYNISIASKNQAEAGTDDTVPMTPLKVAQAIAKLGKSSIPAGLLLDWPLLSPPSWALVRDGSAIGRTVEPLLFNALCPTRSGTLTNGQTTVTGLSTTLDMWVGMPVEGAGIPAGTTVSSITSTTAIMLSAAAMVSGAQVLTLFPFGYGYGGSATTFGVPDDRGLHTRGYDSGRGYEQSTLTANTTNASNVLTGIASTRGLWVGIPVSGAGIPANTTITQINSATSVTISAAATATAASVALMVTGRQVGAEGGDALQNHNHDIVFASSQAPDGTTGNGVAVSDIYVAKTNTYITDVLNARSGPETQVKRRTVLHIIATGRAA